MIGKHYYQKEECEEIASFSFGAGVIFGALTFALTFVFVARIWGLP